MDYSKRTLQAAGILLKLSPRWSEGKGRLLCLLAWADLELRAAGLDPLTGGLDGELEVDLYAYLQPGADRNEFFETPLWSQHVTLNGYRVTLTSDPDLDCLDRESVKVTFDVWKRYRDTNAWDLYDLLFQTLTNNAT